MFILALKFFCTRYVFHLFVHFKLISGGEAGEPTVASGADQDVAVPTAK